MKNEKKRTWAEIRLNHLENNIRKIKALTQDKCRIMAVVKADAYGHGDVKTAERLHALGVDYFAVSNIDEAENIRQVCSGCDILILGYTCPEYTTELIEQDIVQGIVSYENAQSFSEAAAKADKPLRCHIKLDTGMGRVGLKCDTPEQCAEEIVKICKLPNLCIEGVYTHFSCADSDCETDKVYTANQRDFIEKAFALANKILQDKPIKHMHYLNSAALCYYGPQNSTLARAGIIMYGLMPNADLPLPIELEPVMELKTVIAHIKEITCGDCVSYSRTFTSDKSMKIATLPIGYADGYPRALSSKGQVIINGKRCNIIGRVCMDQLMCDISDIDNANVGDEVTMFGVDNGEIITADELASLYGSIGYELVCGISKRVPRIFTE